MTAELVPKIEESPHQGILEKVVQNDTLGQLLNDKDPDYRIAGRGYLAGFEGDHYTTEDIYIPGDENGSVAGAVKADFYQGRKKDKIDGEYRPFEMLVLTEKWDVSNTEYRFNLVTGQIDSVDILKRGGQVGVEYPLDKLEELEQSVTAILHLMERHSET